MEKFNKFQTEYDLYLNSSDSIKEDVIEKALIHHLVNYLGFEYNESLKSNDELKANFRAKFEKLNNQKIPNDQFEKWWIEFNSGDILKRFETLNSNFFQLKDEKGKIIQTFHYFDFENLENNCFEVINQLSTFNQDKTKSRFDILILINGIPTVHLELKNENIVLDEAIRQFDKYTNIGAIANFLCFNKIYVVSNGTQTRYFVNNQLINKDYKNNLFLWTDENNKSIDGEHGILKFANSFFQKNFLIDFINNYLVIDKHNKCVKIFRPYQYYAANKIIKQINNPNLTNKQKSGYVWHATGSGKTLTSFKTCEILSQKCKNVDRTIFLIDRNDLNTQTFNNFKSFAANHNIVENATNTNNLIELLTDITSDKKIIITTIQKLNIALKKENQAKLAKIANKKVVFIVDECHRSQIGEMRSNIERFFQNAINIAFTGTPIFDENAIDGKTTEAIFGELIHKYTLYNAIQDRNVLDFVFNFKHLTKIKESNSQVQKYHDELEDEIEKSDVVEIDKGRIEKIANDICDKYYDKLTRERKFNAILACSTIQEAIEYYNVFQKNKKLKCAIVFSVTKNDNSANTEITKSSLDFMLKRIQEYRSQKYKDDTKIDENNKNFNLQEVFNKYKTEIQNDFVDKKFDLIIVVSMLLTGFDSPITNTLFLDKQLHYQSLIQAISRTNRLYSGKESGNIICYRTNKEDVDEAFKLYINGGTNTPYKPLDYDAVKTEFQEAINELLNQFQTINDVVNTLNSRLDSDCANFLYLFKNVMKLFNRISPLIEFNWKDIDNFSERDFKDYQGAYKSFFSNPKNKKIIETYGEYELTDLETIKIDLNYLKNLFHKIKSFQPNEIPDNIEEFDYYKDLITTINKKLEKNINVEYLKEFLQKREIYLSGDFDKIIQLWKNFINEKIQDIENQAKIKWATNSNTIQVLIDEYEFKKYLDDEIIEKNLENYVDSSSCIEEPDKFDNVKDTIQKIISLREIIGISNNSNF